MQRKTPRPPRPGLVSRRRPRGSVLGALAAGTAAGAAGVLALRSRARGRAPLPAWTSPSARAEIRPHQRFAWRGVSLLVTDERGDCGPHCPLSGYYFREARHVSVLRLEVNGRAPWLCAVGQAGHDDLQLTYIHPETGAETLAGDGQVQRDEDGLPARSLDLEVRHRVAANRLEVEIAVANRAPVAVSAEVAVRLEADFADIQEAQDGGRRRQRAEVETSLEPGALTFRYRHPELPLETQVAAEAGPHALLRADRGRVAARLSLEPQATATVRLCIRPVVPEGVPSDPEAGRREEHARRWATSLVRFAAPRSGSAEDVVACALSDLGSFSLLEGERDEWLAPAAGMPLYPALFGRDALTASWQAALFDRGEMLEAALVRLGRMQGRRDDEWRDEEPGRLPYQSRQGPLARLGVNPYSAYYADYAGPLMYVIALGNLFAWTGDERTLARHWDTARRVLDWARTRGDRDGDGYLEYLTRSPRGTKNQGWKDSADAILYEDGRVVPSPLAPCEVQGYHFAALQTMSVLSWKRGERAEARALWRSAAALKERFNRDFWVEEEGCVGLALDPDKRLVRTVTSNAGHCLASGIVSDEHVPRLVDRLFRPDMFSGWGIRTLSSRHPLFNPLGYHLGSVWAVENATIALGLRRFGFRRRAAQLARGLFDLAHLYPRLRVPECVGGYDRDGRAHPGAYPRANPSQLWNASAFALLVQVLLGIEAVAPYRLLFVDPDLPDWLPEVTLGGLRVGGATVSLRFRRRSGGGCRWEVLEKRGRLRILRQPPLDDLGVGWRGRLRALAAGALGR